MKTRYKQKKYKYLLWTNFYCLDFRSTRILDASWNDYGNALLDASGNFWAMLGKTMAD